MPELPDLQVISSNLAKKYSNHCLIDIVLADKAKTNASAEKILSALRGECLKKVSRLGKEIRFDFSNNHYLMIHLMREGKFFDKDNGAKSTVAKLCFDNDLVLVLDDFMKQAKIEIDPSIPEIPDPLEDKFTLNYLKEKLAQKEKTAIKSFLIDQDIILGIGNAYADEILWKARISPQSKCGNIPEECVSVLYESVKSVLLNAIESIKLLSPDIISGEVRSFLEVHNKEKKITSTGHEILTTKVGGKSTYYTEEQILY